MRARTTSKARSTRRSFSRDAEVRRGGIVLRGERITYTQATDIVDVEGHARVFRGGASFAGLNSRLPRRRADRFDARRAVHLSGAQRTRRSRAGRVPVGTAGADGKREVHDVCARRRRMVGPGRVRRHRFARPVGDGDVGATCISRAFRFWPRQFFGFPIGNQRRSGFLTPSFGLSSTLGTDIRTPYYWNIAPNYDYTISPRVMSKRGVLLGNELRYLEPTFNGTLLYDVIPDDRQTGTSRDYTGVQYQLHRAVGYRGRHQLQPCLRRQLFRRFLQHDPRLIAEGPADRTASCRTRSPYWNTAVRVTKNQVLQDPLAAGYAAVRTRAAGHGHRLCRRLARLGGRGHFGRHTLYEPAGGTAGRNALHHQPARAYPIMAPGWFITPRAQRVGDLLRPRSAIHPSDPTPTRTSADLEPRQRPHLRARHCSGSGARHSKRSSRGCTTPTYRFARRTSLPNFDSALADLNYAQFFTENIYSGYDRIVNANQLTARARDAHPRPGDRCRTPARIGRTTLLLHRPEGHVCLAKPRAPATKATCWQRSTRSSANHGRPSSPCSTRPKPVRSRATAGMRWQPDVRRC